MSNMFAALLARQFAHPVVAADDDEIGGPAMMVLRRALVRGGRRDIDDDDDDRDIDALEGDDEDEYGDDDIGAADRLGDKLKTLDRKIAEAERDRASAEPGSRKWRKADRRLSRLKATRAKKGAKFQKRLDKAVRKGRITPAQASSAASEVSPSSSGGVVSRNAGYPNTWQDRPPFEGRSIPEQLDNRVEREPVGGANPRVQMLIQDPVSGVFGTSALFTVPAGPAVSFPIVAQSSPIAYAGFQVVGIDVIVSVARGENASGFPNQDILPLFTLASYNVNGDKNLLYSTQSLKFASQSTGLGGDERRTISALRENPVLQPTNFVQAAGTFRQTIASANGYNVLVELAAVLRAIYDPAAGIGPR